MSNMNPVQKALYYFIYPTCAMFSVCIFALTILVNDTMNSAFVPTPAAMVWMWIFSLGFSSLSNIFRVTKFNMFARIVIHYFGTILLFILIFLVAVGNYDNWAGAMLVVLAMTIVYFLIAAIGLFIRSMLRRADDKEKKYKRQFNSAGL